MSLDIALRQVHQKMKWVHTHKYQSLNPFSSCCGYNNTLNVLPPTFLMCLIPARSGNTTRIIRRASADVEQESQRFAHGLNEQVAVVNPLQRGERRNVPTSTHPVRLHKGRIRDQRVAPLPAWRPWRWSHRRSRRKETTPLFSLFQPPQEGTELGADAPQAFICSWQAKESVHSRATRTRELHWLALNKKKGWCAWIMNAWVNNNVHAWWSSQSWHF